LMDLTKTAKINNSSLKIILPQLTKQLQL